MKPHIQIITRDNQNGFRDGRSVIDNMYIFTEIIN